MSIRGSVLLALLVIASAQPPQSYAEVADGVSIGRTQNPLCKSGAAYQDPYLGEVCLVGKHGIDVAALYGKKVRLLGDNKAGHGVQLFVIRKVLQTADIDTRAQDGFGQTASNTPSDQTSFAPVQVTGPAVSAMSPVSSNLGYQGAPFVTGVPQCGQSTFENGYLIIVNGCTIQIYVAWTSNGDVWGAVALGPGGKSNTGQSSSAVARAGGVRIFACPGYAIPEGTSGVAIAQHYVGEYRCRK